jgi:uncharacterized protein YdaU (DUF1376 family)
MTTFPWFRWFPGDYGRDTSDLSMIEDAAYRRLLDSYYSDHKLPSDLQRLQRIARASTPEEKAAVQFVVSRFFRADGEHLVNKRAEQEIARRCAFLEEQSRKGKLGGRPPKAGEKPEGKPGKSRGLTGGKPEGKPGESLPEPERSSDPEPSRPHTQRALGRDLKASGRKEPGNGNGSYAAFLAGLSQRKREAVERAVEMARTGEWPARACRRHLLDEGFKRSRLKRSLFRRAQQFITFPAGSTQ